MFFSQANDGSTPHKNYETHVGHVRFGRRKKPVTLQRGGRVGDDDEEWNWHDHLPNDPHHHGENAPHDGAIVIPQAPDGFIPEDERDGRLPRRTVHRRSGVRMVRNNVYHPRMLSNDERLKKHEGHKMYKCKVGGYEANRRKCDDDGDNCGVKTVQVRGHVGYRANCKPENRIRN